MKPSNPFVVLISANSEWDFVCAQFPEKTKESTPYGEYFTALVADEKVIFMHSGWGKISSAGAAQFAIQSWHPALLINLGTCGGLEGLAEVGEILLVDHTAVYDVVEGMSDYAQALSFYSCSNDYSWINAPLPKNTRKDLLISADQDIQSSNYDLISKDFQARVADWESGAIAWVADRHHTPWLILRGVTDLVSRQSAEANGNVNLWHERLQGVMDELLKALPWYLNQFRKNQVS